MLVKSSSRLFPARLVRAEVIGSCTEDTYLIKPNNSPDKLVEIAVTHLVSGDDGCNDSKPPLILLHGCYQNRFFWYSPAGDGLAIELLKHFDVWLMETRGHGLSPVNRRFEQNTLADYASYDLPAVNAFVAEKTSGTPLWLGYAEGVTSLLYAVASGSLLSDSTAAVIGMGKPWLSSRWLKLPLAGVVQSLLISGHHRDVTRGPEPESSGLIKNYRQEQTLFGRPAAQMGVSLWQQLAETDIPLQWLASVSELNLLDKRLARLEGEKLLALGSIGKSLDLFDPLDVDAAKKLVQLLESQLDVLIGAKQSGGEQSEILSAGETTSAA
jgi:pimeloyl-ACP methyl ester carboxylesterase